MKIYKAKPDMGGWGKNYSYNLDAGHPYRLPSIKCDACNVTWGAPALAYPSLDLRNIVTPGRLKEYTRSNPVDIQVLDQLRQPLLPLFDALYLLQPGAQFGMLSGTALGSYSDFTWIGLWTLLIKRDVFDNMEEAGVKGMIGVKPIWKSCSASATNLTELFIQPHLEVLPRINRFEENRRCPVCQRLIISWSEPLVIFEHSIPKDIDIFRGKDITSTIFVTENFKDVTQRLQLLNILFEEVEVEP